MVLKMAKKKKNTKNLAPLTFETGSTTAHQRSGFSSLYRNLGTVRGNLATLIVTFLVYQTLQGFVPKEKGLQDSYMDADAAKTARDSLDLAFQMSNILETGMDRHTLSILIALCDLGLNPEALAAVVKELRRELVPQDASSPSSVQ